MKHLHESLDHFGLSGVLPVVFRNLARVVVERPRLGDFHRHQFDNDVQVVDALKVVGEMRTDTKARNAEFFCVLLDFDSAIGIERIAKDYLLAERVDVEALVFIDNQLELFAVVATVDA